MSIIRVATYARINQPDKVQSLTAQQEKLQAYIERQAEWTLAYQFTDQGSGNAANLPGLQNMLEHARSGDFDLLLVYGLDRLSRSFVYLEGVLEELKMVNVRVCTADESFDSEKLSDSTLLATPSPTS